MTPLICSLLTSPTGKEGGKEVRGGVEISRKGPGVSHEGKDPGIIINTIQPLFTKQGAGDPQGLKRE